MGKKKKKSSQNNQNTPPKGGGGVSDAIHSKHSLTDQSSNYQELNNIIPKKDSLVVNLRKLESVKKSKHVKQENERIVHLHQDDAYILDVRKNEKVILVEVERTKDDYHEKNQDLPHILWNDDGPDVNGRTEPKFITIAKVDIVQKSSVSSTRSLNSKRNNNTTFSPKSPSSTKVELSQGSIRIQPSSLSQSIFSLTSTTSSPTKNNDNNLMITSSSPAIPKDPTTPMNHHQGTTPTSTKSKSATPNFSFKSFVTSPSSTGKAKTGGGEKLYTKILIIPLKAENQNLFKQLAIPAKELHLKPTQEVSNKSTLSTSPKANNNIEVLKRSKRVLEQMVHFVCKEEYFRINDVVTISFQGRRLYFEIVHAVEAITHTYSIDGQDDNNKEQVQGLASSMAKLQLEESPSYYENSTSSSSIIKSIQSQCLDKNVHNILYRVSQDTKIHFDFEEMNAAESSSTSLISTTMSKNIRNALDGEEGHKMEQYSSKFVAGLDSIIERIGTFLIPPLFHPELFPRRGPIRAPKGMLLYGSHGCGKSSLAQQIEQDFKSGSIQSTTATTHDGDNTNLRTLQIETVFINCASIQATTSIVGEAERKLTKMFERAEYRTREGISTLLIMDDIHLICPRRGAPGSAAGSDRVASTLLALMDGVGQQQDDNDIQGSSQRGNVVILAVTTSPAQLDPALRRAGRLDNEIEIPNPDDNARAEIFEFIFNKLGKVGIRLPELDIASYQKFAKLAKGFTGSDIALSVKEAVRCALMKSTDDINKVILTNNDIHHAIKQTKPSAIKSITVEIPSVPWSSIGGMDDVKSRLREAIELPLTHSHLFESLNIPPPRGVLLYGPPGCSKTLMARALATEGHMNFLTVKGPELLSKWLGESERQLASLFRRARAASPCVIFFDEIDAIASKRGSGESAGGERMLSQLLTELDGINMTGSVSTNERSTLKPRVVVVGATNRPDLLDCALTRPGRIDRMIYVGLPDEESREEIFRLQFSGRTCDPNLDISKLARRSEGYSGAEIVSICREAALYAIEEIDDNNNLTEPKIEMKHVEQSITNTKRQITKQMLEFYESFRS